MNKSSIIIRNAIICPDGTYLRSCDRHEYKSHEDTLTGETYIVDGGNDYLRRSINKIPAEDLTVYSDAPFELIRMAFVWKSYGKNYEHLPDGIYIALCDMTTDHIRAILSTQQRIKGTYVEKIFKKELVWRTGTANLGENHEG